MSRLQFLRRPLYLAILLVIVVGVAGGSSAYVTIIQRTSGSSHLTVIRIPLGSHVEPSNFSVIQILSHGYHFRFNIKVTIGVNNTIQWINDDSVEHTVDLYGIPVGANGFSSGLIQPGKSFTQTLMVPGIYNYTCIWHPWLAGQITVRQA